MDRSCFGAFFVDIGGVLLSNGWDSAGRKKAADTFQFNLEEYDLRHREAFDSYEHGKLSLDDYLELTLFFKERPFTKEAFKAFMFAQSKPFPDMLELIKTVKAVSGLKLFLTSNEGRELMEHRMKTFHLNAFADAFFVSSFIGLRKPDPEFYQLALDISGFKPQEIIYIDDRELFVKMGEKMGLAAIHHLSTEKTQRTLKEMLQKEFEHAKYS